MGENLSAAMGLRNLKAINVTMFGIIKSQGS